MADQLSLRGGTTTEHATFTGANKEVTVDTTKKTLVVNDGATVGGHPLMRENASNSALALGSASTPSLKWDANTGIYSPGADQLAVATNGVGRLFVDSAGNVGVGAVPGARFEVSENAGYLRTSCVSTGATLTSNGSFQLTATGAGRDILFTVNGANRALFASNGRFGLGTVSPQSFFNLKLDANSTTPANSASIVLTNKNTTLNGNIAGGIFADGFRDVSDPAYTAGMWFTRNSEAGNLSSSSNIIFGTATTPSTSLPTERLRITSAGLVGIGVSAPQAKLHILDLTASAVELMRLQANLTSPSGNKSITWADATDVVGRISVDYTTPAAKMRFGSLYNSGYQTSDLMTLTPTGLGIGTTTPDVSLHVEGIGTQRVKIEATDTSVAGLIMLNTNRRYDVQVNGSDLQIYDNTASAERARIDSSGRLLIGTSSGTHNLDMGQQLLPVSTTETKSIYRFGNASGLKRKFNLTTVAADRALFSIACGAAGVSNKVALEITVFLTGEKSGVSSDRVFTGKWSVVRGDAGTFTIANVYSAGNAGAATVTASGNNVNINAIFSVVSGGGCFVEIKGLLGTANQGSAENGFTVTMPAI
jgi:hypothetical protein